MDFPHRHGHGHGHRRDDEDDRRGPAPYVEYGQPPAPAYGRPDAHPAPYGGYGQPPPPAYGRPDADPAPFAGYGQPLPSAYGRGDADPYARPAYGQPPPSAYGQPPPPAYGRNEADPYGRAPPPGGYGSDVVHVAHEGGDEMPHYGGGGYGGNVVHVAHEGGDDRPHYGGGGPGYGHETRPYGGVRPEYGHETRPHHGGGGGADLPVRKPTYRIFCKAGGDHYSLAMRDGKVCLVRTDQEDDSQHWIKDLKYSTKVRDEEGYPAMILVNKATGEALKHSLGQSHPVRSASYNPDEMDESVMWTESRDVGDGFHCVRMVNNIYLNFDALHGDKDHGGVRDGTTLVLWQWFEGDNQRWKIVPWCKLSRFLSAYN